MKTNKLHIILSVIVMIPFIVGCNFGKEKKAPIQLSRYSQGTIQIPYDDRGNNQIWVNVELNGVPIKMLFDTGFNGTVSMSLLELQTLAKNGQFTEADVIGTSYASIANGDIVEQGIVFVRSIKLAEGVELTNVRAQVSLNQEAPVLLGMEFANQVASRFEVDKENKTLNITPW